MIDALDIDPDDGVPILEAVERAFGIAIGDAEPAACGTVGDLFDLVRARLPTVARGDTLPCLTALAFRALRRAIAARRPDLHPNGLRPGTPLADLVGARDHRAWHADLAGATGLAVPPPTLAPLWAAVALAGLCAPLGAIAVPHHGPAGLPAGVARALLLLLGPLVATLALRHGRRSWGARCTLGDLARETAARSVARAVEAHGAVREREVWGSLVTLLRPFTARNGRIGPGTRFFARTR